MARHQGRAALVSGSPRLKACRRAARELNRLGLDRYDWVVVTYKMNERQQRCWEPLGQTLVRGNDDRLVPGSRLQSPGLVLVPLSSQAHAYGVVAGQPPGPAADRPRRKALGQRSRRRHCRHLARDCGTTLVTPTMQPLCR